MTFNTVMAVATFCATVCFLSVHAPLVLAVAAPFALLYLFVYVMLLFDKD